VPSLVDRPLYIPVLTYLGSLAAHNFIPFFTNRARAARVPMAAAAAVPIGPQINCPASL
jgi:hypothetical protein